MTSSSLMHLKEDLSHLDSFRYQGRLTRVAGTTLEAVIPQARIGATCVLTPHGAPPLRAEIVAIEGSLAKLMPLGSARGLAVGTRLVMRTGQATVGVGRGMLGRVVGALGEPIDGGGAMEGLVAHPVHALAPPPLSRRPITEPLDLGVRAVGGLLTLGQGQRIAISAGAGVGKSTLLGMMARHTEADVSIIALIGERGREVQEFVAQEIGQGGESAKKTIVVVATSDEPASMRLRAAYTATAIAEYFRDVLGLRVLLLMDSLSRVAMAQREIGLSVGEMPASRGYPPSAFALIPSLLERAGMGRCGSITAVYTTLFDDGDEVDPISDAVRATTDGHLVLSREFAQRGIYPALDVARSISRVMNQVTTPEHQGLVRQAREVLHHYTAAQDLVSLGAYVPGSNHAYDRALELGPGLLAYLKQPPQTRVSISQAVAELRDLMLAPSLGGARLQGQAPKASQGNRGVKAYQASPA